MKFAIFALIAAVSAVKIRGEEDHAGKHPDAKTVISWCDADGDGKLTLAEGEACIDKQEKDDDEHWAKERSYDTAYWATWRDAILNDAMTHDKNGDAVLDESEMQKFLDKFFKENKGKA